MERTNNYNDLKPFRFWCQKVLPLVYDDSLSYYELLDKVIDYLNKTMEDVTVLNDDTEAMYAAYNQLQSYVNNYFDNLDVQDEINAKLDQMAIDGTLSSLINPQIPGAVSAWLAANVNPVGSAVIVDATLSIPGAAADAKATGDALNGKQDILSFDNTPTAGSGNPVRSFGIKNYVDGAVANVVGEISDLKGDLGQYKQTFTMSNQYLSTFTIPYTPKFYFKLLSHPEAKFAGCRIYGVTNGVETEITTGNFIHEEFYYSIPTEYDTIKLTAGFGVRVSGDVTVILADVEGLTISAKTIKNELSIKDLLRSVKPKLTGDLYEDIPFISGKNIVSDFTKCNVDNYIEILQTSSVASIAAHAVKIRDDNGNLFSDIYFIAPTTRANDNMCWTFDKDGNPIGAITGAHLNDGFSSNVYYIVLVNYWGLKTVKALYDPDKEYTFEVAPTGKLYSSVTECLTRIAHVPYKKKVLIYSGTYDIYSEIGGDTFANAIPTGTNWRTVSVVVENNTHIKGIGNVYLTMTPTNINSNAASLLSPLNISGDVTIENINIICSNCRYGIHIEGSNLAAYNNTTCTLKNVNVVRRPAEGSAQSNRPVIGVGMNARSMLIFDGCRINAIGGWAGLYYHENTATEEFSPALRIFNSIFTIVSGYALALSASANQTTMIDTFITSSYIKSLRKMTGGNSAFNDAYKIIMLNCNMPDISASDLMQNEITIEHYNTIA